MGSGVEIAMPPHDPAGAVVHRRGGRDRYAGGGERR